MSVLYKQKGAEATRKCAECSTMWRDSWLEGRQKDGTCPWCHRNMNLETVIKVEPIKRKHQIPIYVRLNLTKQNLVTELMERYTIEFYKNDSFEYQGTDVGVQSLLSKIEQLDKKIRFVRWWCHKNERNINNLYKFPGTNSK